MISTPNDLNEYDNYEETILKEDLEKLNQIDQYAIKVIDLEKDTIVLGRAQEFIKNTFKEIQDAINDAEKEEEASISNYKTQVPPSHTGSV